MKQPLITLLQQQLSLLLLLLFLAVIVQCTHIGDSTTTHFPSSSSTPSSSPPKDASLPSVAAKGFLEMKAGSWPSVDPKGDPSGLFYLRHLSRPQERFFNLADRLLSRLHPDAPFLFTFRYWASHDLARVRVYLAGGGHQDHLLDRGNQWTDAAVSIVPAKSGRWTHLELLGADHPYTFALKNATGKERGGG